MKVNNKVSILIAARPFFTKPLRECLRSIQKNTQNFANVEILVKVDDDCTESQETIKTFSSSLPLQVFVLPGKYRRTGLAYYWNTLAEHSTGGIIWPLSDRITIETYGWEKSFNDIYNRYLILRPSTSLGASEWCAHTPIITRPVYTVLNCVSPYNAEDVFLNMIADKVPELRYQVPIVISHSFPHQPYPLAQEIQSPLSWKDVEQEFKDQVDYKAELLRRYL